MRVSGYGLTDALVLGPHQLRELVRCERDVACHVGSHGRVGETSGRPFRRNTRLRPYGGGRSDLRVGVGEQRRLDRHRAVVPGSRDRGSEPRIPRVGKLRSRPAVDLHQQRDADRFLKVDHETDEVRASVTDRRIRMLGDPAAHLRGDPVLAQLHRHVRAVMCQQSLHHGVRQLPAAQGQTVPAGRVRGQADQDVLGSGRVARQPGEPRMREGGHAVNLVGARRRLVGS